MTTLCFHGVGDPPPGEDARYWVARATFCRVLDLAHELGLAVTFDDGYYSDIAVALEELRQRTLTAEFFPVAGRLGQSGYVSGADLRTLRDHGMVIGSHGMNHVPWRGLSDAALREELVTARGLLEGEVERPVTAAACPLGRYDARVIAALRRAGFTRIYTSDRAIGRSGALLQPRYTVRADDDVGSLLGHINPVWWRRIQDRVRLAVKARR